MDLGGSVVRVRVRAAAERVDLTPQEITDLRPHTELEEGVETVTGVRVDTETEVQEDGERFLMSPLSPDTPERSLMPLMEVAEAEAEALIIIVELMEVCTEEAPEVLGWDHMRTEQTELS